MRDFRHYFKTDIIRLCKSGTWLIGIIGVTFFLFFSLETHGILSENVLSTYFLSSTLAGVLITYVFCAFPYTFVFGADLEYKYIRYALIRGNLKSYTASKAIVIYLSSVMTMVSGTLLFLLLCHTKYPWVNFHIDDLEILRIGSYGELLEQGHYLIYGILYALHMGMLAGFLSLFAAFCSIYISNKAMVLVLPILLFQILAAYDFCEYNIYIFFAYTRIYNENWKNFLFIFLLSMVPSILLTIGIYRGLKRRM